MNGWHYWLALVILSVPVLQLTVQQDLQLKSCRIKNAGYTTVGRYLTGDLVMGGKRVAKNLLRGEMQTIFDTGLNLLLFSGFKRRVCSAS